MRRERGERGFCFGGLRREKGRKGQKIETVGGLAGLEGVWLAHGFGSILHLVFGGIGLGWLFRTRTHTFVSLIFQVYILLLTLFFIF